MYFNSHKTILHADFSLPYHFETFKHENEKRPRFFILPIKNSTKGILNWFNFTNIEIITLLCFRMKRKVNDCKTIDKENDQVSDLSYNISSSELDTSFDAAFSSDNEYEDIKGFHQFHRCTVLTVIEEGDIKILNVTSNNCIKKIELHDSWVNTELKSGSVVNIVYSINCTIGSTVIVDNNNHFLIVDPDICIAGTTIVSCLRCPRQFCIGIMENDVELELLTYINPIKSIIQGFFNTIRKKDNIKIKNIDYIEESIWCMVYGIRGRIDISAKGYMDGECEMLNMAIELKSGKATFSSEHVGQVLLYILLMSFKRNVKLEYGWLSYIKHNLTKSVKFNYNVIKGLMQTRNNLIKNFSTTNLPKTINIERQCTRCFQKTACALCYYNKEEESDGEDFFDFEEELPSFIDDSVTHLKKNEIKYFSKKYEILNYEEEYKISKYNPNRIWTLSAEECESQQTCLSNVKIDFDKSFALKNNFNNFNKLVCFTRSIDFDGATQSTDTLDHSMLGCESLLHAGLCVKDPVVISVQNSIVNICIANGFIDTVEDDQLTILCTDQFYKNYSDNTIYRIDKISNYFDSMKRDISYIYFLMSDNVKSSRLRKFLIHDEIPQFSDSRVFNKMMSTQPILQKLFDSLNKYQQNAVLKVLACKDYALINGFPGSGKSYTIIVLVQIYLLVFPQSKILISSCTNAAIDNILEKFNEVDQDYCRMGYSGSNEQIMNQSFAILTKNIKSVKEMKLFFDRQRVVACTCFSLVNNLIHLFPSGLQNLQNNDSYFFDLVILDEATQISESLSVGSLLMAEKFVLIGDVHQLPPIVSSHKASQLGMSVSLFERLTRIENNQATVSLNAQYRMNRTIMSIANDLIYENCLVCGNETIANRVLPKLDVDVYF
ncbi:DNA replication ATP-dependent helicase-like protein [Intoshia linei]|uniref:DNA replication ATP-dependent helicase/nuclease n=1 Tax=Intoshia linei TaxID=1819745 RepID=A0A177AUT2_9BILA|nr:DNA replication ATP-dependent helicase-like protein [Intoshia linei]